MVITNYDYKQKRLKNITYLKYNKYIYKHPAQGAIVFLYTLINKKKTQYSHKIKNKRNNKSIYKKKLKKSIKIPLALMGTNLANINFFKNDNKNTFHCKRSQV